MSSCSRRYASKSIRNLKHLHQPLPVPEPLWFLYPQWFRLDSSHQYHTEPVRGQDHRRTHQRRDARTKVAVAAPALKNIISQRYHSIGVLPNKSSNKPAHVSSSDAAIIEHAHTGVSRTALHKNSLFRKTVPSTSWIPRPENIPRQEVLERRAHYIRTVNPTMLLNLLRSIPVNPPEPSRGVPVIALSVTAQHELVHDISKDNTWRHYDGSSCTVKFSKGCVELYGTERAREIAQKHFSDVRRYTRSQEHLDWYARAMHGSYLPINDLPPPPAWTVRSFVDYVRLLTRPRFRRSALRNVYGDNGSHHQAVFKTLRDIFTHQASAPFVSTEALRLALSYCRRHTEFPTTAASLWKAFLNVGLHPDTACFNEELGRCLVGKEFNRFCKLILEMRQLDIQPDATTWALVMTYTNRHSARVEILRLAKEGGLTELDVHASLVAATAKKEIQACPGTQDGVKHFMKWMESQFGANWLTSRVLERLLRACRVGNAKLGLTSELILALKAADKTTLIDQKCLVELIHIARKAGNFLDALELVKNKALSPISDMPQVVIDVLFSMAWRRRYFNLCRFFWFLGATAGRITFKMQDLVSTSLKSNTSKIEDPSEASWQLLAGKVIVGTSLDTAGFTNLFPTLTREEIQSTPVEWLLQWTPDGTPRTEQIQLGRLLVERDLNAFRFYHRPSRHHFLRLLDEALTLDEEWKATSATTTVSPGELVTRSLKIDLTRREESLKCPRGNEEENQRRWFIVNGHKLDYDTLQYQKNGDIETGTTHETRDSGNKRWVDEGIVRSYKLDRLSVSENSANGSQVHSQDMLESDAVEQRVIWQGTA